MTELFEFMKPKFGVCGCHGLFGWLIGIIYAINHVVVCMRPEMAVKFGFTK